ncbi:MAG: response regulator [Cytophagaceae bacterium]
MNGLGCVLVVDDDPVSNYITEKVVKSNDGSTLVTSTTDGLRALDYIRYQCSEDEDSSCPDLIILDINMPKLGGVGFLKKFNALNIKKHAAILILTNVMPSEEILEQLKEHHVVGVELKPFSTDKLQKIVQEITVDS